MSAVESWSVRGIAQQARLAAKSAARQEGLSLGEWLNKVILEQGFAKQVEANPSHTMAAYNQNNPAGLTGPAHQAENPRPGQGFSSVSNDVQQAGLSANNPFNQQLEAVIQSLSNNDIRANATNLERLAAQLEALEARSSISWANLDKTLLDVVKRSDSFEEEVEKQNKNIQKLAKSQIDLSENLEKSVLEKSDSVEKKIERNTKALHDLDEHFADLLRRLQNDQQAYKVENDKQNHERDEAYQRKMHEQFQNQKNAFHAQLTQSRTELFDHIQSEIQSVKKSQNVSDQFEKIEQKLNESQNKIFEQFQENNTQIEALNAHIEHEQKTTDQTLSTFKRSLHKLEEDLNGLRSQLPDGKQQKNEIKNIEKTLSFIQESTARSKQKYNEALQKMVEQVDSLGSHMTRRISQIEQSRKNDKEKGLDSFEGRINTIEQKNAETIQFIGEQVAKVSEGLAQRITKYEERSSEAFENMVEQVAKLTSQSLNTNNHSQIDHNDIKQLLQNNESYIRSQIEDVKQVLSEQIKADMLHHSDALTPIKTVTEHLTKRLAAVEKTIIDDYEKKAELEARSKHFPEEIEKTEEIEAQTLEQDALEPKADQEGFENARAESVNSEVDHLLSKDLQSEEVYADETGHEEIDALLRKSASQFSPLSVFANTSVSKEENKSTSDAMEDNMEDNPESGMIEAQKDEAHPSGAGQPEKAVFGAVAYKAETEEAQTDGIENASTEFESGEQSFKEKLFGSDPVSQQVPNAEALEADKEALSDEPFSYPKPQQNKSKLKPLLIAGVPLAVFAVLGAGGWYAYQSGLIPDTMTAFIKGYEPDGSQKAVAASVIDETQQTDFTVQEDYTVIPETADTQIPDETPDQSSDLIQGETGRYAEASIIPSLKVQKGQAYQLEKDLALTINSESTQLSPLEELKRSSGSGDAVAQYKLALHYKSIKQNRDAFTVLLKAADSSFPLAQLELAGFYEYGIGTSENIKQAIHYYKLAADAGNRQAMNSLGNIYASKKLGKADYKLASEWFEKAADLGLVEAQYNLAMLYQHGYGVPKHIPDAYAWYTIAARSGDEEALKQSRQMEKQLSDDLVKSVNDVIKNFRARPVNRAANELLEESSHQL